MFEKFYTTKMSGNKKALQKRFTKIRSKSSRTSKFVAAVMSVALIAAAVVATVAVAASENDGLEHQEKNETYFISGIKSNIQVDLNRMPDWIKDISSDGSINIEVNYIETKQTKSLGYYNGNINRSITAKFSGDKGSTGIDNGLCATISQRTHAFCNLADDEKAFILFMPLNSSGDITSYSVCFTVPQSNELAFSHTEEYKENYISVNEEAIEYIGDFKSSLKRADYFTMPDYFASYEEFFRNVRAEGIDMAVTELDREGFSLKVNVSNTEADTLKICVRPRYAVMAGGKYIAKELKDINNTEIRIDNHTQHTYYFYDSFKEFLPGEEYVIDLILLKTDKKLDVNDGYMTANQTVVYRQRDYMTMK